jgi:hypothetical protein
MLREALAFEITRALGMPAPRTGFVELFVNEQLFGLYTLVEPVDSRFLAAHYGNGDGPLYEGEYGCDFHADDVRSMELDDGRDEGRARVLALAQAAAGPSQQLFADDGLLDVAALQRFLAVSALIGDFDGYRHAHNYRAYRDPVRERWSLLPWGLDRALKKPTAAFDSHGLLAVRCFDDAACRLGYIQTLHTQSLRFDALRPEARLDALDGVVRRAVQRDPRRPHDDAERAEQMQRTRRFLRTRAAELRKQVDCWDGEREHDRDADGYGCTDCDDADPGVHPGAQELCNGVDDDCSRAADDAPQCGCETLALEGSRFALCKVALPWARAEQLCAQRGGHLARIDGKDQSRALYEAAKAIEDGEWWIGLHDREREAELAWSDGAGVRFVYWASGEPDHYACGQDCVALKQGARGKWRDMHCASPRPFICREP